MFVDNNLFNPQWSTGNLSAIGPIVQVVGFIAMCFISMGGFFMVVLPIMRNTVNGIVVVAPNFCDKIDEAHRTKLGLNSTEGGNQIQMVIGSLATMFLSFFPNFKALSDFEDGIRDPKSFMTKAVAMMCIYVFIGVFIFYGYPAKIAEKFSGAATGVIDMALNNVDPAAWVEKIPTNLARPDLSTSNATDEKGKNVNKVSKSMYSTFTSKYSAMSKENRIALSHEIESFIDNKLSQITNHSDSASFKMTVESRVMSYDPQLTNSGVVWPAPSHDEANNIYIYQFKGNVAENFNVGIPGGVEADHFMVVLKFFELSEKGDKASRVRNTATFFTNSSDTKLTSATKESTLTLSDTYFSVSGLNPKVTINGIESVDVKRNTQTKTIVIKFGVSADTLKQSKGGTTSGLFYIDPNNKSYQHPIVGVNWSEGSSKTKFTPEDATLYTSWELGGSPNPNKSSKNSNTSTGRTSDDE